MCFRLDFVISCSVQDPCLMVYRKVEENVGNHGNNLDLISGRRVQANHAHALYAQTATSCCLPLKSCCVWLSHWPNYSSDLLELPAWESVITSISLAANQSNAEMDF